MGDGRRGRINEKLRVIEKMEQGKDEGNYMKKNREKGPKNASFWVLEGGGVFRPPCRRAN